MQQVFDQYINYLTAEKNASPYTVRNYTSDLMGGSTEKGQKGFFIVCSKVVLFIFREGFLKYVSANIFLFGANFQTLF